MERVKNSIAILIPNFNGAKFITKTIIGFKQGFPLLPILIVDDVSTDNSIEVLKNIPSDYIAREKNGGFAAAVNTGLRKLTKEGVDIILVTNSDIEMDGDTATKISKSLEDFIKDPKAGVLGFLESSTWEKKIRSGSDISGFLFALKKEVIEKIGYLDERFFMYGEEQDYFRRTILAGFTIIQSEIKVNHKVEGSGKSKLKNSWLAIRNSIFLEAKNFQIKATLRKIASLFLIINKLYRPKVLNDPSLARVQRPGILLGNLFLISAIFWNIFKLATDRIPYNEPKS